MLWHATVVAAVIASSSSICRLASLKMARESASSCLPSQQKGMAPHVSASRDLCWTKTQLQHEESFSVSCGGHCLLYMSYSLFQHCQYSELSCSTELFLFMNTPLWTKARQHWRFVLPFTLNWGTVLKPFRIMNHTAVSKQSTISSWTFRSVKPGWPCLLPRDHVLVSTFF